VGRGEAGLVTYRNAAGARLIGLELEARTNLEFVTPVLRPFSVVSNLTLAHSRIQLEDEAVLSLTNRSRPLVNQAPFVYNLAFDYTNDESGTSARVLYNIVGPRIAEVGSDGLEDAYEHPRNIVDVTLQQTFAKSWQVKLSVKNLLNSPVLITQGCGDDGLFGSTWHLSCSSEENTIARRYTEGATFSLTAGYTH
jgi:outer membrane receptor protein involved in Fe transport